MMISTKGRYALRVMVDMAENGGDVGYMPLGGIAERQGLSEKYLESIIAVLVKAGILRGQRGKGGGYMLTKAPSDYTVGSILKLTEGSLAPVSCIEGCGEGCANASECRTLPVWKKLDTIIDDYLEGVNLSDLMRSGSSANGPCI